MTIVSASAVSLSKAKELLPRDDALLISILGRHESKNSARPLLLGWRGSLSLEFEDISEESSLAKIGAWPDNPSAEENAHHVGDGRGQLPSILHARQISDFLHHHHQAQEKLDLIVHCYAGISRSVMVAYKAACWFKLPEENALGAKIKYSNPRVGRLMELARSDHESSLSAAPNTMKNRP